MTVKMTAAEFCESLKPDLGYDEQPNNRTKFAACAGHPNGQAWCATYVSCKLITAGVLPQGHSVLSPSSRTMYATAVKKGWGVKAADVQPGDICHLARGPLKGWKGHVGVVVRVVRVAGKVTEIWSIEGNASAQGHATSGGSVGLHKRPPSTWGLGFWRPPYAALPSKPQPVTAPAPVVAPKPVVQAGVAAPVRTDLDKQITRLEVLLHSLEDRIKVLEASK